jgi:hypothetical protein
MLKKKNLLKIFVVLVVILLAYTYLHAIIALNYPIICDSKSDQNDLIIEGTSMFLQSNSDVLLLLNEVEIAEIKAFDFDYAFKLTESAIYKLENAKIFYTDVINFGEVGCEGKAMTEKFLRFDYDLFVEKNHLNNQIMGEVSELLKKGDTIGVYKKSINDINKILLTLNQIKKGILMKQKPDIKLFWSLLQQYNILGLYGNYATLVFYSV